MGKIHKLPTKLIPKIAAGEVVEKPASVVKELLDNALDAGASQIGVEIENSGLKRIRVVDDGEAMSPDDVKMCFLSHATSKIYTLEDLAGIKTLGFRGEALSSISSVAKVKIKSREAASDKGFEISIDGGDSASGCVVGMSPGTVVEVNQLFFNVPARKKFLKTQQTEYRHILDVITSYVLAHPGVGFRFSRDGKMVFDIAASQSVWERIQELLGVDLSMSMMYFEERNERVKMSGYLSKPQVSAKSKINQFTFVNSRVVEDKLISDAVKDAYGNAIESKSYPPFVLYFEVDPGLIDVNIHPRKEKISFWDEEYVYDFVYNSVKDFLEREDISYALEDHGKIYQIPRGASPYVFSKLKESVESWVLGDKASDDPPVFQLGNTYLVTHTEEGLVLLDQHAVHEAILYKQFMEGYEEQLQGEAVVDLESPVILEMSLAQTEMLREYSEILSNIGFSIEIFGKNSFRVTSVPEMAQDYDIKRLIDELLVEFQKSKKARKLDDITKRTISFLACRGAVKAGDAITEDQQYELIGKLEDIGEYTCPHGRPAKITITYSELDRMFKRK